MADSEDAREVRARDLLAAYMVAFHHDPKSIGEAANNLFDGGGACAFKRAFVLSGKIDSATSEETNPNIVAMALLLRTAVALRELSGVNEPHLALGAAVSMLTYFRCDDDLPEIFRSFRRVEVGRAEALQFLSAVEPSGRA